MTIDLICRNNFTCSWYDEVRVFQNEATAKEGKVVMRITSYRKDGEEFRVFNNAGTLFDKKSLIAFIKELIQVAEKMK